MRLLSLVDVFEPLSREEIENLVWRNPSVSLEKGEVFYGPGDLGETLFVLKRGRVRIYKMTPEGREFTLAMVESGTIFGEMSLTAQRLHGAYAEAMEPSEVAVMRRDDLERLVREHPDVGIRIMGVLSERLRSHETRMEDMGSREVLARLASLVLLLCESEGVKMRETIRIPTHYTHHYLGTMIGANREAVTKAFTELQESGALELVQRNIHIKDVEALKKAAGK